jgi:hypothetical protein
MVIEGGFVVEIDRTKMCDSLIPRRRLRRDDVDNVSSTDLGKKMVDNEGFDPSTSRMLSVRSTN